jgi:WD40 repeat protein
MGNTNKKPVIFLAFANNASEPLPKLQDEFQNLRTALQGAEDEGLCEVHAEPFATRELIFDLFSDARFRNRVAVFHFAGHAEAYQLLLSKTGGKTQIAHAAGLARLLGQQTGLQLVFLNGCATQPQARALFDANVPAVIATSTAIADQAAMIFASRFYRCVAEGADIATAFKEAEAEVLTANSSNLHYLYAGSPPPDEEFPWHLQIRPGAETVERWNLPDAAGNPLFGLPPLPIQDLPESPFRHLNWFTWEHAEVFFGRGHQTRRLYTLITTPDSAPIILFYGQSGVGKSSVLAAGLIPRLEHSHDVRYQRRDQKEGLLGTFRGALFPEGGDIHLAVAWRTLEEQLKRPIVIILDQVEEVFTRPNLQQPDELKELLHVLQSVFAKPANRPKGKLILSFRKDWLAELADQLSQSKLPYKAEFLNRLDRRGLIEAVSGPAHLKRLEDHYGLTVDVRLPELIANDLLADLDSPVAPTVQILLTKLWEKAKERNYAHPHFDIDSYQQLKKEGLLLKDFLDQQLAALEKWNSDEVNSGLVLDVLMFHTTSLGTAEQRTGDALNENYRHKLEILPALIQKCKDLYLLIDVSKKQQKPSSTRLAHDTLAPLIRKLFSVSDKPGHRARRILESRAVEWREGKEGNPLDAADLSIVEGGQSGMRVWTDDESRLVEMSRIKVNRQITLEQARSLATEATAAVAQYPQRSILLAVEAIDRAHQYGLRIPAAEQVLYDVLTYAGGYTLSGHKGGINAVAISADNRWLVTGSQDNTARLWDLTAVDPAASATVLSGHESTVGAVAISPDNRWLVTGSGDKTARLWDLNTTDPAASVRVLRGHKDQISVVTISADNRWLVTGSKDRTARLWDLSATDPATSSIVLRGHDHHITAVTISGDSRWLVTADLNDRRTRLWDLTAADPAASSTALYGHKSRIETMAISPDNRWLVTGSMDRTVRLWDLTAADPAASATVLRGHENDVLAVSFSTDNRWLVTGSMDRTARLWDLTATDLADSATVLHGHEDLIRAVMISADSRWLVTGSRDKTARLWDLTATDPAANATVLRGHEGTIAALAISADSRWLVTGSWSDPTARLWDLTATDPAANATVLRGHEGTIAALAISADSRWVLTGSWDNTARLWDLTATDPAGSATVLRGHRRHVMAVAISADSRWIVTGSWDKTARLWDLTAADPAASSIVLSGHERTVDEVAINPDNRWLVTGSNDKTARLWDLTATDPASGVRVLRGHEDEVWTVAISADNRWVVTGSKDRTARLWDLATTDPAAGAIVLRGHEGTITSLSIGTDSHWLVTGSKDNTARLWDLTTADPAASAIVLGGHEGPVEAVAISADSRWIVTGSWDKTARLWDLTAADPAARAIVLHGHESGILAVAISADSRWLVTGSMDRTVRLWDLTAADPATGAIVLRGHALAITALAISADSRMLVTGSGDDTARVWILRQDELIRRACRVAGRNLRRREWQQYFPREEYRKTFSELPDGRGD